ncbi:hypothetical protein GCM10010381_02440 [Streptomyces xantholiticus]|nr:hypothetical protein GCM10010381_02440 [Streptomyces xantholiticus]
MLRAGQLVPEPPAAVTPSTLYQAESRGRSRPAAERTGRGTVRTPPAEAEVALTLSKAPVPVPDSAYSWWAPVHVWRREATEATRGPSWSPENAQRPSGFLRYDL